MVIIFYNLLFIRPPYWFCWILYVKFCSVRTHTFVSLVIAARCWCQWNFLDEPSILCISYIETRIHSTRIRIIRTTYTCMATNTRKQVKFHTYIQCSMFTYSSITIPYAEAQLYSVYGTFSFYILIQAKHIWRHAHYVGWMVLLCVAELQNCWSNLSQSEKWNNNIEFRWYCTICLNE